MGKIVKYCNSCEESFTEKFGFCPICGKEMDAFEMKPVADAVIAEELPTEEFKVEEVLSQPVVAEEITAEVLINDEDAVSNVNEVVLKPLTFEQREMNSAAGNFEPPATADLFAHTDDDSLDEPELELDLVDEGEFAGPLPISKPAFSVVGSAAGNDSESSEEVQQATIDYSEYKPIDSNENNFSTNYDDDDDFHVTVLTEKNVKERNMLFLGTMVLMLMLSVGVVIGSIFNHPLLIGAIGEDELMAYINVDQVPMTVEEEQKKLDDDKGGGGGGGGRDEQTPTSKGRLATQTEKPLIAPDTSIVQKDFELKSPIASTQGTKQIKPTDEPYGDPNAALTAKLSNGLGTGGGQGSGMGTGQGSGRGTGQGSGIGSGSGSGIGDGSGDGTGRGRGNDREPPPQATPRPVGPSTNVKFISKPQPKYTDAARQNNVQGNVVLRITFLSNGQIGSIAPVSGLSYGLTEQAIAAARQIRFEPAMRNGQPYSVTKSVQYTFTIY